MGSGNKGIVRVYHGGEPVSDSNPLPVTGDFTANIGSLEFDGNGNLKVTIIDSGDNATSFVDDGGIAHDESDSTSKPLKIGAKAVSALSGVTLVTAADRTNVYADLAGRLITAPCPTGDLVSGVATISDGSSTQVIAAQASGIAVVITSCIVNNSDADTGGYIEIKDGTTVKAVMPCPAAINSAGSAGSQFHFSPGILGTAATAWNADPSGTIDAVKVTLIGYKIKV